MTFFLYNILYGIEDNLNFYYSRLRLLGSLE